MIVDNQDPAYGTGKSTKPLVSLLHVSTQYKCCEVVFRLYLCVLFGVQELLPPNVSMKICILVSILVDQPFVRSDVQLLFQ